MEYQKVEIWPITKLIAYARNPRKNDHAVDHMAAQIKEFGFRVPIVAKSDGVIVDGHLRLKAAKKLKLQKVPVMLADDMTKAQIKAFRLSVNKSAELAEWDTDLLAVELQELDAMEFDVEMLGFEDLDKLLDPLPEFNEGNTDADEVPEIPQNIHGVKLGQVYSLGNHRIMCGDSTDKDSVSKLMDGEAADMVFTDPPYGDNVGGLKQYTGEEKKMRNKQGKSLVYQDSTLENDKTIEWLAGCFPIIPVKDKSTKLVFFKWDKFTDILNYAECWGKPSACLVWDRVRKASAFFRFQPQHEFIFHWGNQSDKREKSSLSNVFHFQKDESEIHPTVKPIELLEPIILVCSSIGELICDPFLGSGSTLIACEKTARKCYGMELDPHYCSVIIERWQNFTGQKAELIDG